MTTYVYERRQVAFAQVMRKLVAVMLGPVNAGCYVWEIIPQMYF